MSSEFFSRSNLASLIGAAFLIACVATTVSSCASSDSSKDDGDTSDASGFLVNTAGGTQESAEGIWQSQCMAGTPDQIWVFTVTGTSVQFVTRDYPGSSDGTCAGSISETLQYTRTLASTGDITAQWSDGSTIQATAPTGLGGTTLPNPALATGVQHLSTVDGSILLYSAWLIDDTGGGTARKIYTGISTPTASCDDGSGVVLCLRTTIVWTKLET